MEEELALEEVLLDVFMLAKVVFLLEVD